MAEAGQRVAALAAQDPQCNRAFGARAHRYRLAPPLQEEKVAAVERAHGVSLPRDYREFITTVGNGGAGPGYGLLPFDGPEQHRLLSSPFPVAHEWNPSRDDPAELAAVEAMGGYYHERWLDGTLLLADLGCGNSMFLVVNGPEPVRGVVFADLRTVALGLKPLFNRFDDWYDHWLRSALDPQVGQCPAPRERCSLPNGILNFLGARQQQLGVPELSDAQQTAALQSIPDGAIVTSAGGTDRVFDEGDRMRLCHCCGAYIDWFVERGRMRPLQVADGVPPKAGRGA